jgi:hypothetical protein
MPEVLYGLLAMHEVLIVLAQRPVCLYGWLSGWLEWESRDWVAGNVCILSSTHYIAGNGGWFLEGNAAAGKLLRPYKALMCSKAR